MVTIGILSDTHQESLTSQFIDQCHSAFADCEVVIHAGDLTDISLLSVFKGKEVHAVHGNSCNQLTRQSLPEEKIIIVSGYQIAITHGAGPYHNIEDRVFDKFSHLDCIIFGHSHRPVCQTYGKTLMVNPGSFRNTGKYGNPGTYGILRVSSKGLYAEILPLPQPK